MRGPFTRATASSCYEELTRILQLVPDSPLRIPAEQQSCIDLLKLFPKHGDPILEAAQRALDEANELTDLLRAVQANTAKLEAVSSEEEHTHDWIAFNQWLEGLSVAQRADMTEHLANAHKALDAANEQAAERVLIWMVRTWGGGL